MTTMNENIVRLRKTSGQPIMDCKRALQKTDSFDEAFEYLRKNASEKIDANRKNRVMSEGRVVVQCSHEHPVCGSKIVMASLLCETDFTARSEAFINTLDGIAEILVEKEEPANLELIQNNINEIKAQTGENVRLGTTYIMVVPENASIGYYVHFDDKKAAVVQFETNSNPASLQKLGNSIAMHIVATKPRYLDKKEYNLDPTKDVTMPKGMENKPEDIKMKIMNGVVKKHMSETVLLKQPFCLDDSITIEQAILNVRRQEMMEITLKKFKHIEIGE